MFGKLTYILGFIELSQLNNSNIEICISDRAKQTTGLGRKFLKILREKKYLDLYPIVTSLQLKDFQEVFIHFQKSLQSGCLLTIQKRSLPSLTWSYNLPIGQSNYSGNSSPFPCLIFYTGSKKYYKERGKDETRENWETVRKMEKKKKNRAEEKEVVRTPKPEAESWLKRKRRISLSLVINILTRSLAFIKKEKKKSKAEVVFQRTQHSQNSMT